MVEPPGIAPGSSSLITWAFIPIAAPKSGPFNIGVFAGEGKAADDLFFLSCFAIYPIPICGEGCRLFAEHQADPLNRNFDYAGGSVSAIRLLAGSF